VGKKRKRKEKTFLTSHKYSLWQLKKEGSHKLKGQTREPRERLLRANVLYKGEGFFTGRRGTGSKETKRRVTYSQRMIRLQNLTLGQKKVSNKEGKEERTTGSSNFNEMRLGLRREDFSENRAFGSVQGKHRLGGEKRGMGQEKP